jgi:ribosomal protein S18 acetylase RimI-like enzyme
MTKEIIKPPHPKLPEGFTVRPARMEDVDELVEMFNELSIEMIGSKNWEADELRNDFKSDNFDMEKDTRVIISLEGKIVAYQDVFAIHNTPVHPNIMGRVHKNYHNMGFGTYLMNWAIQRAHHVIDKVPEEARVSMRTSVVSSWEPAINLFEENGLERIRVFYQMVIDMQEAPPQPDWSEGISVRAYRHPEEAEAVFQVVREVFRDHYGYIEEPFEEGFKRFQHFHINDENFASDLWFLAVDGDQIVGVCLCNKHGYESEDHGYVSHLGVRQPWRKRGIGLALLLHSFNAYWDRNQKSVRLGVDAENLTDAVRLYEKAGMHVQRRYDVYELELRPGCELSVE